MKKLIVLINSLLILLGSGIACYGKAVDENTAKTIGGNYLVSMGLPGVKGSSDLTLSYVAADLINGANTVDYYVFNLVSGKGFVMVSGDDNIIPVLAYSGEFPFDINHMAPATRAWIDGYKNQITAAIVHELPAKPGTPALWSSLMTEQKHVAAKTTATFPSSTYFLCSTTWDQDPGYDNYCPSGAVTGCVATAMAQVMKYWNWPTIGCGAHTYTESPNPYAYPGQSADFGNTAYNWASMNTSLTAPNPAVETLMYHCGVATDMQYGPAAAGGSGTYVTESETPYPHVTSAEYALKTYFHYKRSLHGVMRGGFTTDFYIAFHILSQPDYSADAAWIAILEAELNAGRPMLYKGNESGGGGHCWVCDGYDATNKMHFNWGWSGASNGYYTVDNLAPPALGTGGGSGNFNTDQGIIAGIQPDSFINATANLKLASHVDVPNNDAISYNSAFSVIATVNNTNTTAFSGSFSAQVFDTFNHYVATVKTLTGQSIAAGSSSSPLVFGTTGMLAMIPGQYIIKIMYQANGTSTWTPVGNNATFINYNLLDVRNTGYGSGLGMELMAPITVTTGTSMLVGGAITLNSSVQYYVQGSSFNGTIQAVLTNVNTGATFVVQTYTGQTLGGLLPAILPYSFTNSHVTVPGGQYALSIQYQNSGTGPFDYVGADYYVNPVLIQVHTNVGVSNVTNGADISVFPNPANDVINIAAETTVIDNITITDMQGREVKHMAATGVQMNIAVPVNDLAPGMYLAQLHTETGVVTRKIVIAK